MLARPRWASKGKEKKRADSQKKNILEKKKNRTNWRRIPGGIRGLTNRRKPAGRAPLG